MKDYHINVFYSEDDEGYIADIPDLQHCSAFGTTPEEALREVLQAKEAWLEAVGCRRSVRRGARLPWLIPGPRTLDTPPPCLCQGLSHPA